MSLLARLLCSVYLISSAIGGKPCAHVFVRSGEYGINYKFIPIRRPADLEDVVFVVVSQRHPQHSAIAEHKRSIWRENILELTKVLNKKP